MRYLIKILALLLFFSYDCLAGPEMLLVRISLDQATKQVLGRGDYRVLGAQTTVIDGREIHIIKVLTPDGRIQYFKIDAETGALIS
ncbi:MAG: PepSY domain-containing protein [Gammaproteobacteria bacterium]